MAVSIIFGRDSTEISVNECFKAVQQLLDRLDGRLGSTHCKALINCDLGTDEGQTYFIENELIQKCREITRTATEIVMEIIAANLPQI